MRIAPASTAAREALARAYLERREYLEAIEQWRAILSRNRQAVGPRVQIARAYASMGLLDQAVRYYSEALDLAPDNAALRREMERVVDRIRDPDQ
ncbi:MAG: tetratricopeptide repeat protein [Acidobacteriota bacterium]